MSSADVPLVVLTPATLTLRAPAREHIEASIGGPISTMERERRASAAASSDASRSSSKRSFASSVSSAFSNASRKVKKGLKKTGDAILDSIAAPYRYLEDLSPEEASRVGYYSAF